MYGVGAFVNNLLGAAIGGMMIILNLGFGMDPALVGLLGGLPRIMDAFTDPLMGYISDHTRSKWGRRRPYIFWGAIGAGVIFALLWQLPAGKSETFHFVYFLVGSLIFYLAYTVFATPWVALGYELTPDYNERTRLMGVQNFMGQLPYLIAPWFLWIVSNKRLFDTQAKGASGLSIVVAVVVVSVGVIPAIFLKERFKESSPDQGAVSRSASGRGVGAVIREFFTGFGDTLKSRPFIKICIATFMVFNGFMLISSFQFYVIIYYVFGGDQAAGAKFAGYAGTVQSISTFLVIIFITWLGTKIGKRKAFFLSTSLSMLGFALKWICYNPDIPILVIVPAPLLAFGLGGLFVLMPSMIADVVDVDELQTHERREGMYGSIFWWMVKLGMAAALAGGGLLLKATGFDVDFGGEQPAHTILRLRLFDAGLPIVTSLIAIWAIARFKITEEHAREVRMKLEERRGKAKAVRA